MKTPAIQRKLKIPLMAAIEVGIPPPLQLLDLDKTMLAERPMRAAPTISKGIHIGFARTASYIEAEICTTHSVRILKAVIRIAEINPVNTEKTRQGKSIPLAFL